MNEQEQQGMPPVPQPAESEQPAAPEQAAAPAQPVPEQPIAEAPQPVSAPVEQPAPAVPAQPAAAPAEPAAPAQPAPEQPAAPASVPPAWSAAGMPQPPVAPATGTTQAAPGATQQASWQVPQSQPAPEQPPAYSQPPAAGYAAPAQADMPSPVQPQKKSNAGLVVGGIVAVLLVVVAVVLVAFVIPNLNSPSASTGGVTIDEPAEEPAEPNAPADDPAEPSVPADADAETLVTAAAEAELDKLKNADPEALALVGDIVNEGFENQTDETLETCGVDPEEYARIMLEDFSYTIDDVYVYESIDEATVYATVTCRDVFELIDNYNYMLEAYVNSEDYQYTSYEEDCQRMGMIFIEAAESAGMNGGYQMTIDLTYENGSWVVDEDQWESELDWLFDVE